jgi:hypothetical protein
MLVHPSREERSGGRKNSAGATREKEKKYKAGWGLSG